LNTVFLQFISDIAHRSANTINASGSKRNCCDKTKEASIRLWLSIAFWEEQLLGASCPLGLSLQ
jgi:hypothetical protein